MHQALVALGLTDDDWSAFCRLFNEPRIGYEELGSCFLCETLKHMPETEHYVAVVDGVQGMLTGYPVTGPTTHKVLGLPNFK